MTRTDVLRDIIYYSGLLDREDGRSGKKVGRYDMPGEYYYSGRAASWIAEMKQRYPMHVIAEYSFLAGSIDEVIFPTEAEHLDQEGREMVEDLRAEWEDRRDYARFLCGCWELPFPESFGMGLNRQLYLLEKELGEDFLNERGELAHPERVGQEPMTRVEYIQYNQELPCRAEIIYKQTQHLFRKVLWGQRHISPGSEGWQEHLSDTRRLAAARAEQIFYTNYWFHDEPPSLEAEIEIQLFGKRMLLA